MARRICARRLLKASKLSRICAATPPATLSRSLSSTPRAAAARCRSIPVTFFITTTRKLSFAITRGRFSSIPRQGTRTSSSPLSESTTTNTCTRNARRHFERSAVEKSLTSETDSPRCLQLGRSATRRIRRGEHDRVAAIFCRREGSVAIMLGLVRSFHRHAEVIGLCFGEPSELDADLVQVKASYFFIELFT